jgi:hypothetical protein
MNIFLCIMTIFLPFIKTQSSKEPARLDKIENRNTSFQILCKRACPYVLLICMIILVILLFVVLVRYGHAITGTEANQFYYHLNDI